LKWSSISPVTKPSGRVLAAFFDLAGFAFVAVCRAAFDNAVVAMSGDQIRAVWIRPGRGYAASQVDELLRRIAVEVDAGNSAAPLIEQARFTKVLWGYDVLPVDWLLDQLRRPDGREPEGEGFDPWRGLGMVAQVRTSSRPERPAGGWGSYVRAQFSTDEWGQEPADFEAAWDGFGQLPGLKLRLRKTGIRRRALVTADEQAIATGRGSHVEAGGRKYRLRLAARTRSSHPAIAEVAACSIRDTAGHFAQPPDVPSVLAPRWRVRVLCDYAGAAVLYLTGDPVDRRDRARITFPDRRSLRFHVRGTQRTNAIMTAVDQSGANLVRYRLAGDTTEVIVNPGVPFSDELVPMVMVSAGLLGQYFLNSGGGA
jgi:hypothetical protein